ncbi:MAG: ribose 5-phosphate isomerase B [Myxococcota bacterium]|jgi:ribose 5-phosphate isomerase B
MGDVMRIWVGADHGGVALKMVLVERLEELGHIVTDIGADGAKSVDYPDYARPVAEAVADGRAERGLLVCGSGQGMAMAACKVPGVRAACVSDPVSARLVVEHNDARVLCLGARIVGVELALGCLSAWLDASFEGGRHTRRVGKIEALPPQDG